MYQVMYGVGTFFVKGHTQKHPFNLEAKGLTKDVEFFWDYCVDETMLKAFICLIKIDVPIFLGRK